MKINKSLSTIKGSNQDSILSIPKYVPLIEQQTPKQLESTVERVKTANQHKIFRIRNTSP